MDAKVVDKTRTISSREKPPLVIKRVDVIPVALPLKKPMAMAGVNITHADNILVRIETSDGTVGWGEVASAPTRTGDTLDGLVAGVRDHLSPALVGKDANDLTTLRRAMRISLFGNTGARSAVETALLDVVGRVSGKPLIELLGSVSRKEVAPMWLLGNATVDADIAEAHAKQREGFHFFKLKIGTKPIEKEIAGTVTLRKAVGGEMPLCADANCGLTLADAQRYVSETRAAQLKFVEQPLPPEELGELAALTKNSPVPIGADESFHSMADLDTIARCGVGGVSLKSTKLGGLIAAVDAARRCRELNLSVNIAVLIAESSIASAAAVHLACAVPDVSWGVSLTHFYLADDIVRRPLPLGNGTVALPAGPGLGVDVDEDAVARYRRRMQSSCTACA